VTSGRVKKQRIIGHTGTACGVDSGKRGEEEVNRVVEGGNHLVSAG